MTYNQSSSQAYMTQELIKPSLVPETALANLIQKMKTSGLETVVPQFT